MKKYNLSKIMKRAWELVKRAGITISAGLKKAWDEAKNVKEKFTKSAKILKEGSLGESDSDYLYFSRWEKYGKKRAYINDYKGRTIGYIENGKFVKYDGMGCTEKEIQSTIDSFYSCYEM